MDNLVSIIVPVYNNEKFLEKCLNSIINQTYKNLEIILINDGSTDDSRKICERFLSKDNRIKIINQKNSGVSVARNSGLRSATGDFVCFIDSDDYLELDYVEKMYSVFSEYDLVISEYYINSGDQEIYKSYDIKDVLNKKEFLEKISLDELYCGYLWNKIYKLSIIKQNNIEFNPKINIMEDFLFNINYASFIQKVKIINKPLYHYLDNPSGALNSIKKNKDKTVLEALELIIDIYESNELQEQADSFKIKYILESYRIKYEFLKETNSEKINEYKNQLPSIFKLDISNKMKIKFLILTKFPNIYYKIKRIIKK